MSIERVFANELRYHIEHIDVFAGCLLLKPKPQPDPSPNQSLLF